MRYCDPSRRDLLRMLSLAPSASAAQPVTFTDMVAEAGLSRARNVSGEAVDKQYLIEEMGAGVALFDFDNDGWLDIFLVNGSTFQNSTSTRKPTSYLFRNNRDGTFTDVTQKAGLTATGWGQGCCVGDYGPGLREDSSSRGSFSASRQRGGCPPGGGEAGQQRKERRGPSHRPPRRRLPRPAAPLPPYGPASMTP